MVRSGGVEAACAVVLLCPLVGCESPAQSNGLRDALNAKAALLERMRAEPSVFVGADPNRMEKIEVVPAEDGEFSWGAFTINTRRLFFTADVETHYDMSFYGGTFSVDADGRWVATLTNYAQAHKDPAKEP